MCDTCPCAFFKKEPSNYLPFGNTQQAHLGCVEKEDLPFILKWRNEQLPILRQSAPLSMQEHLDYWNNVAYKQMQGSFPKQLLFSYKQGPMLVGYGGFVYIDWEKESAEISTLLDSSLTGESARFLDLTQTYLELTFELAAQVGLKRLRTECFDSRVELIERLESLGFVRKAYTSERKKLSLPSGDSLWLGSWHHEKALL